MAIKNRIQNNIDMTQGNFVPLIIKFALPLILGDLFQQLYNLTDTWVLGNFASNDEYAAVGATTYILNFVIKSFIGLSTGASAIVARSFGSGDKEKTRISAQTAFLIGLACCVIFTAFGTLTIPLTLKLTKVPAEIYNYSKTYLTIIFSCASSQVIYNMGAGILRAVGDTRKPFYYLVVASFINVVLDLFLVVGKGMGVKGVAIATVVAQTVAAILITYELCTTELPVKLDFTKKYDKKLGSQMIKLGLPTALQMCIGSIATMFAQSYINSLGVDFMSGYSSYHKVEEILFMSANSFGVAALTITSQNLGAKNIDRIKKGIKTSILISASYCACLVLILMCFAPQIVAFFNSKPEVVAYAADLCRLVSPFFILFCMGQCFMSAIRGLGNSTGPLIVHIITNVVIRTSFLAIMYNTGNISPKIIGIAFPIVWIINASIMFAIYRKEIKKVEAYQAQKPI